MKIFPSTSNPKTVGGVFRAALIVFLIFLVLLLVSRVVSMRSPGGLMGSWGPAGMSPEILEEAEILCSGHFVGSWNLFSWSRKVELKSGDGGTMERTILVRRKMVTLVVDHYWKGQGPAKIEVALFEPVEGNWRDDWQFPQNQNLLLALKTDTTGSAGYQLVNQANSWLVAGAFPERSGESLVPQRVVEDLASDDLIRMAEDPENQSYSVDGRKYKRFKQAAATVRNFRTNNPKVNAVLENFSSNPTSPLQRESFVTLSRVDPVRAWNVGRLLYQSGQLEAQIFRNIFPQVITSQTFSQVDPKMLGELFEADPILAESISEAFRDMEDPRTLPWLARCLNHPNKMVQYRGMKGLYGAFGKKEKIPMPMVNAFEIHPDKYLEPYKRWVTAHPAEFSSAAP